MSYRIWFGDFAAASEASEAGEAYVGNRSYATQADAALAALRLGNEASEDFHVLFLDGKPVGCGWDDGLGRTVGFWAAEVEG